MKKVFYILLLACVTSISSCAQDENGKKTVGSEPADSASVAASDDSVAKDTPKTTATAFDPAKIQMKKVKVGTKEYNVADITDSCRIYRDKAVKANCFFVVSKQEFRLYVYEVVGKDTLLAAHYPVCYAKFPEGKTKTGDMRTPDCSIDKPFKICEIMNASSWSHDFKDGRGSIKAYGDWFLRLDLSKSDCAAGCRTNRSIGIHGSTNNAASVPGRDSEGCIRLRDADIKDLKTRFVTVGTKVVVKNYQKGKYPFEIKAEQACEGYQSPVLGRN